MKKKIPNAPWATLPQIKQEESVCSTYWAPAVYEHSCVPSTIVDITRGCPVGPSWLQKQVPMEKVRQQICSKQALAGIQRLDWAGVPKVERTYLLGALEARSMWLALGSQGWGKEHKAWEEVCGRKELGRKKTGLGNPWRQEERQGADMQEPELKWRVWVSLQRCGTMSTVKLPVGPVSVLIDSAAHRMLIEKAEKPRIPQQPKMTS